MEFISSTIGGLSLFLQLKATAKYFGCQTIHAYACLDHCTPAWNPQALFPRITLYTTVTTAATYRRFQSR